MHHTLSSVRTQQRFIQSQRIESDCQSTFNLLTSNILFDEVEKRLPEHRERLFPPTETLAMFVTQALSADRSCQHVVNQAAVQRLVTGLPGCSTHTGGYCRARQRLPIEMISGLSRHLGQQINQQIPKDWRWHGRRVRLVDGTTVTMPDTSENQSAYPQQRGQKEGLGFPICRVVGITCLASGALLNAAVGRFNGKGGDEQTLLRSIQETLEPGDILILYTDGIPEARDASGEQYGMERFQEILNAWRSRPAEEIVDRIVRDVAAYTGSDVFEDDLTLIVAKATVSEVSASGEFSTSSGLFTSDNS